MNDEGQRVRFDTKIAVLLRDDLQTWRRLNVCAFLVSGLAAADPGVIGEPYEDADGTPYLPMFRQPVLVFEGSEGGADGSARAGTGPRHQADGVHVGPVRAPATMRTTEPPSRGVPRDELDLVGIAMHSARNAVDKVIKGAHMHP